MDYRAWMDSTCAFFEGLRGVEGATNIWSEIEDPATEGEVEAVERELGRRLPAALRSYLLNASKGSNLGYRWEAPAHLADSARRVFQTTIVFGGLFDVFCDLNAIVSLSKGIADLREYERGQRQEWRDPYLSDAMIGIGYANGDYLALDLAKHADDPPVIYLAHDDSSYEMAPSFDAFLARWATLCYMNPCPVVPFSVFVDREGGGKSKGNREALDALHGYLRRG